MNTTKQIIKGCVAQSNSHFELWIRFFQSTKVRHVAEVGVYRGDFED